MCHSSQLNTYYDTKSKTYHTQKSFEFVSDKLKNSDLVLGNLETTLVPRFEDYSGYPRFGSPDDFAPTLKESGFHILSTANNHSADKGSIGIDHTISKLLSIGLVPIGTYSSNEDYQNRRNLIIERNGIKIAIYNYTYSTNGIKVPNGRIVRLIDKETISEDISFAKSKLVDFIIVWYHFGTEYQIKPDSAQINWANYALSLGADAVIGGHPHVVQRIEKKDEKLVAYSLGNFLSAQNRPFTDGGMILSFDLIVSKTGKKEFLNILPEPVWVLPAGYKIIPIEDAMNDMTKYPINPNHVRRMKIYKKEFDNVMKQNDF